MASAAARPPADVLGLCPGGRFRYVSGLTSKAVASAHDALHNAESHASRAMDSAQAKLENRMGSGMYLPHGGGMLQIGRAHV